MYRYYCRCIPVATPLSNEHVPSYTTELDQGREQDEILSLHQIDVSQHRTPTAAVHDKKPKRLRRPFGGVFPGEASGLKVTLIPILPMSKPRAAGEETKVAGR